MPRRPSPVPPEPNNQPPVSLDDLEFADALDGLLKKARALAEVTKWTAKDALLDDTEPLHNTMAVLTDILDEAFALADRWYQGKHPDSPR
jgi:hypothetical protein